MVALEKLMTAMVEARDLIRKGEVLEGYEIIIDGVRLYAGRYFGQDDGTETEVDRGTFRMAVPVLPHIISFGVQHIPADKRPALSVICALSLSDLLEIDSHIADKSTRRHVRSTKGDYTLGKEIREIEHKLSQKRIALDIYGFSELDYAVLSLPAEP